MTWRNSLKILILGTVIVWVAYDIATYMKYGNQSTISVFLQIWGAHFPGIEILFGILIGHLFFNQTGTDINGKPQ